MLLLLFDLGPDRYALDCRDVVEVLPLVGLKQLPRAPAGVAGILNYRGEAVPVIDLTALLVGRFSHPSLTTRLMVVHYPVAEGRFRPLGLIAEHVTETARRNDADFTAAGIRLDGAPSLGRVATDARGIVQLVEVKGLLTPDVCDLLFRSPLEV